MFDDKSEKDNLDAYKNNIANLGHLIQNWK